MPGPRTNRKSRTTRIADDVGAKLDELLEVLDAYSADYLDSLIREKIEADHRANIDAIRALRKARERAAKQRGEAVEG